MKTHTIEVGPDAKLVEVCNTYEDRGWSVRQIVPSTAYGFVYVVFEADHDAAAFVPAGLPARSFTGTVQQALPQRT